MKGLTIERQTELLKECALTDESVTERLETLGLRFDDLRYLKSATFEAPKGTFTLFDNLDTAPPTVNAISFFTGAGGMDLGLTKAGFRTLAAIEHEALFCQTLRKNDPSLPVFGPPTHTGDVKDTDKIISSLESIGITEDFEGLFHGGPPCQPFSIASNQRFAKTDDNFKRTGFSSEKGTLLNDFVKIALHFKPRCLLIENVPGLLDIDGGEQLRAVYDELIEGGYWVADPLLLNARDYGVPQDRKRLFIVAWRGPGAMAVPVKQALVTVDQAFRATVSHLPDHVTRDHKAASLLRYVELDYGQRDQLGRVDRLHPARPSKTVIAGGLHGGGRSHLHPNVPRTLSPRESARLQTFPDNYEFAGTAARQFTQIGNAVPPMLAYRLGKVVMDGVFNARTLF